MTTHLNSSPLVGDNSFQNEPNSNLRFDGFLKLTSSHWNVQNPTQNPRLENFQIAPPQGVGVLDKPIDTCAPQEKKFLIFDRSGNRTRLFFSSSFSPQNQDIDSKTPVSTQKVESSPVVSYPIVEEKSDENDLNDEEDQMFENSNEIDALLYSGSYDDDEYDDDDEVTSTRHVSFGIGEDPLPKRQRLIYEGYKKSSLTSYESPVKCANSSCNYDDDCESCYLGERHFNDGTDSSKKDKIREMLKMMETIIPGSGNDKDPVSIIEKAIVYLESMRKEAEAFGLSEPESKSGTYT